MTKKVHGRHGSRWVALQGLYAWAVTGASLDSIEADLVSKDFQFEKNQPAHKISFDSAYLHELIHAIGAQAGVLDELIIPHIERPLPEINPVEHGILRIAMYELKDRAEIPYRVVINEAILLAKQFGAQDSHKFVNGVLDKAAKIIRDQECNAVR